MRQNKAIIALRSMNWLMMTNLCLPSCSRVGFIYTFWCSLWSTGSILEYIYLSQSVQQGPWKPENLNLNLKFQVQVKSNLTIISFKFSSVKLDELENFKSSQVWKVKNLTWLEIYYWNNKNMAKVVDDFRKSEKRFTEWKNQIGMEKRWAAIFYQINQENT